VKLVGLVRKWTEVSRVLVSESEIKTVTCVIHYKFVILDSLKINTLGENCHQFLLAYQNLTKPVDLKRGDPRIQQIGFSDLEGLKFQIYIRWKVRQHNRLQIKVFKSAFFLTLHIF
jgi:hypothetical protein